MPFSTTVDFPLVHSFQTRSPGYGACRPLVMKDPLRIGASGQVNRDRLMSP
jgi:hypothetical protein